VGWRAKFPFSPKCLTDWAPIARDKRDHENLFFLALITIAIEIYSDAALTSAEVTHTAAPERPPSPMDSNTVRRPFAHWRVEDRGCAFRRGRAAGELKDFRRKVSDAGRATHNARTGARDDLVLAIALWWATTSGPMTVIEPFPLV